jgi:hypothetical protein
MVEKIKLTTQSEEYRNSQSIITKAKMTPEVCKKISIALTGKTSHKKGKTLEECYGKEKADSMKKSYSVAFKGRKYSKETNMKKGRFGTENAMSRPDIKLKQILAIRNHGKQWKGGLSYEPYSINFTRQLRQQIRNRDDNKCQFCCKSSIELGYKCHVHHIDYDKLNYLEDNLISLCKECHAMTNWNRGKWYAFYVRKIGEINGQEKNRMAQRQSFGLIDNS